MILQEFPPLLVPCRERARLTYTQPVGTPLAKVKRIERKKKVLSAFSALVRVQLVLTTPIPREPRYLLKYPESGKVVPGSGGVRKVRWAMSGRGKSGGLRVIYYFKKQDDEIWLLTIYSKNEVENIPAHILRQIAKEIENV